MKTHNVVLVKFTDGKGNVLLNRRSHPGSAQKAWGVIGGGIEEGEHPTLAIKREVMEELGYELDETKDKLTFVKKFRMRHKTFSATIHYFEAKFPGLHHFSDSDEVTIADLGLFPVEKARTLPLMPMTKEIL